MAPASISSTIPLFFRKTLCTRLCQIANESCHSRWNLPAVLVIANSEKIFPRSLNVSLPRATFVAWWKQSPYKLPTDRHTTFAMTIRTAFVMTKTKMAARHKVSRHDNLFFRCSRLWGVIETLCARS